ncbi:MAG: ABC transporter ATP-binding protein [Kiloniellales bacterium]
MSGAVLLETKALSKRFGGVVAANNIDFTVTEGELRCLIGPNGAGKSTLFSMLCGIQKADSGEIYAFGKRVTHRQAFHRVRRGLGLTFQSNRAFHDLSVAENLAIPRKPLHARSHQKAAERYRYALDAFGLDPADQTRSGELSHDQLQWLEIAMVLAGFPDLVMLDEPTAGMATEETNRTAEVLKALQDSGLTLLVVEHDMAFVRLVADSVTVLHQGTIFAEGTVEDITTSEAVRSIYLGKA